MLQCVCNHIERLFRTCKSTFYFIRPFIIRHYPLGIIEIITSISSRMVSKYNSSKDKLLPVSHSDQGSALNTPKICDLYNIENGSKKILFDWNDTSLSSDVPTDNFTGTHPWNIEPSQDGPSTTTIAGKIRSKMIEISNTILFRI